MSSILMKSDGFYGKVELPTSLFRRLDKHFFISCCTPSVKYMCANEDEARHLKSLGVKVLEHCDWYKIVLQGSDEQ